MRLQTILTSILVALLMGCAPMPVVYTDLRTPSAARSFSLNASIVAVQRVGAVEWEYGLITGTYRAVYENADGTLFQGPGRSILLHHSRAYRIHPGGVFVSRKAGELPRLYVYAHQDFQDYQDLASAQAAQRAAVTAVASSSSLSTDTTSVVLGVLPGTTSAVQAGVGASVANAIVGSIVDADIERERGKPLSLFHVDNEVLQRAIAAGGSGG